MFAPAIDRCYAFPWESRVLGNAIDITDRDGTNVCTVIDSDSDELTPRMIKRSELLSRLDDVLERFEQSITQLLLFSGRLGYDVRENGGYLQSVRLFCELSGRAEAEFLPPRAEKADKGIGLGAVEEWCAGTGRDPKDFAGPPKGGIQNEGG